MIYDIPTITSIYGPIFKKYHITDVWLFGSYARGEAYESSDVDFLVDDEHINPTDIMNLFDELYNATDKSVDMISTGDLNQFDESFIDKLFNERIQLQY